jgi:hypothetical protein
MTHGPIPVFRHWKGTGGPDIIEKRVVERVAETAELLYGLLGRGVIRNQNPEIAVVLSE